MSLSKSTESLRTNTHLDKSPVYEALPAYFELEYPVFTAFLESYYEYFSDEKATSLVHNPDFMRDFVGAQDELLRFMSKELLLGRDYFDKFVDKENAIQVSNLLYRSKGTRYSIQMFFRVFFGFDVDVRYGRDEVFLVGDPGQETLVYKSEMRKGTLFPGNRLRFTFDDGDIQVYANAKLPRESVRYGLYALGNYADDQDDYVEPFTRDLEFNVFFPLREEIDFTIDYDDMAVVLQPVPEGYEAVRDDPYLSFLAENGYMPEGQSARIEIKRYSPALSAVGPEVTNKRITNNGFWQLYSIAIRAPISITKWRDPYKDFVHPAGVYLEGEIAVESIVDKILANQPAASTEAYALDVSSISRIEETVLSQLTELNIDTYKPTQTSGYAQSGFVTNGRTPYRTIKAFDSAGVPFYTEERVDSEQADAVYRTRINDITNLPFTMAELDTQYQRMDRIDTIEPRTLDNVEADFSNTINTLDENRWLGTTGNILCQDSDGNSQNILGNVLDFAPEVVGCPGYIFNLFGLTRGPGGAGGPLKGYSSTGQNFHLVNGVAQRKYTAYRDERVWGTTVGNNFSDPFNTDSSLGFPGDADYANPFQYSVVNGSAANVILYHLSGYMVNGGPIGAGDSEDYMGAFVKYDDSFGVQTLIELPDSNGLWK